MTDVQSDAATLAPGEGERSRLRQHSRRSFPGARGLRDLWNAAGPLGPFWITISLSAFIAAPTFLYVPLIGGDVNGYLSFVYFAAIRP